MVKEGGDHGCGFAALVMLRGAGEEWEWVCEGREAEVGRGVLDVRLVYIHLFNFEYMELSI